MPYTISLEGKKALVTGGARGIGAEICRQFAIAGADIAINYYHSDADRQAAASLKTEMENLGSSILLCEADVSNEKEVDAMVRNMADHFGSIDIIANNAGILESSPFDELDTNTWNRILGVILQGSFYVTRAVVPYMLKKSSGSIIMITTNCTVNGGGGSAAYPAAKAGVEGLARQLTVEYAGRGIRTNIIRPAVIDTELFRQRYNTDEAVREYGKKLPVGRVGKPEDIANLAVFLASDKSSYICGAAIPVDGGRTYYK